MPLSFPSLSRFVQRTIGASVGVILLAACTSLKEDVAPIDAGNGGEDAADAAPAVDVSCKQIHADRPDAPSGTYALVDGRAFTAYCEMDLNGGGWTAFYSALNGSPNNTFGTFKDDTDACPNPKTKCLHRTPPSVTTATEFMATCGPAAVSFNLGADAIRYFALGVDRNWLPTLNRQVVAGDFDAGIASVLWTGEGLDTGWILSLNDHDPAPTEHTFAAGFHYSATWNYCNGKLDTSSAIHLYYR